MSKNQNINRTTPQGIIIMLLIVICCSTLSIFVSVGTLSIWGNGISELGIDRVNLQHLRIIQIIQSIGTFILPSIMGVWLFYGNSYKSCFGHRSLNAQTVLISILIISISSPLINWASFVNQNIPFPTSLDFIKQWMEAKEQDAIGMTRRFLTMATPSDILINTFIMAVLPAIGEEWLFRGLVQPLTARVTKKMSYAIVITAILFSAMHMQFLTFFPRVILGVILGYLYYYGRNLWLPIIAHFTNNFIALLVYAHHTQQGNHDIDPLTATSEAPAMILSIMSFSLIIAGLYWIKHKSTPD